MTKLIVATAIIFQLIGLSPVHAQYQVDSVVHILGDRVIKTSQQVDHLSNTLLRTYMSTDQKENVKLEGLKDFSKFDSEDKLIFRSTSQWNAVIEDWEEAEKTEIKFDENARAIIFRTSRRDDRGGWEQASLDSVIYYKDSIETFSFEESELATKNVSYLDAQENDYLTINFQWNKQNKKWNSWAKTDFVHRENGAIEESSTYLWQAGGGYRVRKLRIYLPTVRKDQLAVLSTAVMNRDGNPN
ncbi:hypothetical protein [Sphingobacterium corticibacter]|uniref:DUF3836 domain-containing protein n=1 Tax=Sphingobacterium corticibacter TaxID=2171749 RepID=A0A2T8HNE0_9SPHI|nr:hypothetical protein [Sphingobacterium corticibacter]PVH26923.1 hypothetical protein DC487_04830 [Sphingobacterium corticibacter]